MCDLRKEKDCRKTYSKADVSFSSGSQFCSGKVTNISASCMCIDTNFRLPEYSRLKLLCRNKKALDLNVRVAETAYNVRSYKMKVEVLNPSLDYCYLIDKTF